MANDAAAQSRAPVVREVAVYPFDGGEQVVLNADQALTYSSFMLDNPPRLVIDTPSLTWKVENGLPPNYQGKLLKSIRYGQFNPQTSRMVFDLAKEIELANVAVQNRGDGLYLVAFNLVEKGYVAPAAKDIEAELAEEMEMASRVSPKRARNVATSSGYLRLPEDHPESKPDLSKPPSPAVEPAPPSNPLPADSPFQGGAVPQPVAKPGSTAGNEEIAALNKPTVVIDAGHGGRDPGASGGSGTREKDVTLIYAKALRDALLRTGRYRVVLTREDDRFILLRGRLAIGRQAKGDAFISLHADSAPNPSARGLSVYTLSENASDKEAAALAARENKVDIIYGLDLSVESKDVTEILIDLAQRETMNKSTRMADIVVDALAEEVQLLKNSHRYAGFAVLKAPDVPSMLIELGFLSNRKDEALIRSSNYRERLVNAIVRGLDKYFKTQKFWQAPE